VGRPHRFASRRHQARDGSAPHAARNRKKQMAGRAPRKEKSLLIRVRRTGEKRKTTGPFHVANKIGRDTAGSAVLCWGSGQSAARGKGSAARLPSRAPPPSTPRGFLMAAAGPPAGRIQMLSSEWKKITRSLMMPGPRFTRRRDYFIKKNARPNPPLKDKEKSGAGMHGPQRNPRAFPKFEARAIQRDPPPSAWVHSRLIEGREGRKRSL